MDTAVVTLEDGLRVKTEVRGHVWYSDTNEADGGADSAGTPEELLLGALGSCMVMTAKLYANRKGWALDQAEVRLELERIDPTDYPGCTGEAKFAHRIREHITIGGATLTDEQITRIREIMGKCPVRRVIANPVVFEAMTLETA